MGDNDLFDVFPDVDFDGDHDLQDLLFLEDMLEEEERITTSSGKSSAAYLLDDDEDDLDDDDTEDYVPPATVKQSKSSGARRAVTRERFQVKKSEEEDIFFEYGIDPEDYIIRIEYEEAVYDAKYGWREYADYGLEYGLDPEDFETEDEYIEAWENLVLGDHSDEEDSDDEHELSIEISFDDDEDEDDDELDKSAYPNGIAYRQAEAQKYLKYIQKETWYAEEEKTQRCKFIAENRAEAAKYLTVDGVYLYAQAVKDHFTLPFDIPDEWDEYATSFETLLQDLAEHDTQFAIEVWEWCMDTFMPHIQYDEYKSDLTHVILLDMSSFVDEFPACIVSHMVKKPAFIDKLISQCTDTLWCIEDFVVRALRGGHVDIARKIMDCAFANPHTTVHDKVEFIDSCISECSDWDVPETMELFEKHVFPIVFSETDVRIKNKISRWQQTVKEYYETVEQDSEEYQYPRANAWRAKYYDSEVDHTRYDSEEEYLAAVHERKYGWRKYCSNRFGIDPANYETRAEYNAAVNAECEKERMSHNRERGVNPEDRNIYRFCKVKVDLQDNRYYYYLTGKLELKVGDRVSVPFGKDSILTNAQVMSVGECFGCAFPCHISLIKTVFKKLG